MQETKTRQKQKPLVRSVVSNTSILILSAFLIGNAAGKVFSSTVETYLYLIGIFGVTAYVGLDHLARRRREKAAARKQKRAAKKLANRMSRHIPSHMTALVNRRQDKSSDGSCQFMTVVNSGQLLNRQ